MESALTDIGESTARLVTEGWPQIISTIILIAGRAAAPEAPERMR